MIWTELLHNPQAVRSAFSIVPSLTRCEIMEVCFHRNGPRMTIVFDIQDFPVHPPERWLRDDANTVQLKLQLFHISKVTVAQWACHNVADITLARDDSGLIQFAARGETVQIVVVGRLLRLESISAYHNTIKQNAIE